MTAMVYLIGIRSNGGPDVFVHISAVERAGLSGLAEAQQIEFETEIGKNEKSAAINLKAR